MTTPGTQARDNVLVQLRPIRERLAAPHMHRSGWPFALSALEPLFSDDAFVTFDDFLEKTFFKKRIGRTTHGHSVPWVGFCHHPYDAPEWYVTEHLSALDALAEWHESLPHLRLCFTLAENLATWVRQTWRVPCVAIKHPSERPQVVWSPQRFSANRNKLLLQVGWYLRNTWAIYQLHEPAFMQKAWLRQSSPQVDANHQLCREHCSGRQLIGRVREIPAVSNAEYDRLLSENVVFVELISAAANNTVVECIARSTPLVINRHPGPEYYLGHSYPLFYENIADIPALVTPESILQAHQYLKALKKDWLDADAFLREVNNACGSFVPECRPPSRDASWVRQDIS